MFPRRHDRYVLRSFWTTFLAVVVFFTLIVVVLDSAERIRKLPRNWDQIAARGQHPLLVLAEYYATLLPFLWMKLFTFCVPAATAFCIARLIRHDELTPLVTSGVSLRRIVWPIVLSGVVIVGGMLVLQETVIPSLNRRHLRLSRIIKRNAPDRIAQVPHFHDRRGGRLSMQAYMPIQQRMEAVTLTFFDTTRGAPQTQLWYPELKWDGGRGAWLATSGGWSIPLDREAPGVHREAIPQGALAPLDGSAAFIEMSVTSSISPGLSRAQVEELAEANPENLRFPVMKNEMLTGPISAFILLLLALPFSLRVARRTKSAMPGMLGMLLVAALFFGAQFLAGSLARAGDLNPIVLTWLPTVLFGSLAVSAYLTIDG